MMLLKIWRAIWLGWVLSLRSRSWAQVGAIVATAIAALFLALASALPGVISERADRAMDREPRADLTVENNPQVLVGTRLNIIEGQPAVLFLVAGDTGVNPPSGLDRLPQPGEYMASPAYIQAVEKGIAGAVLPGQSQGVIGNEGLRYPDELVAWVGVTPQELPQAGAAQTGGFGSGVFTAHGFGVPHGHAVSTYQISEYRMPPVVRGLLLVCAVVAAIPALLAAATASLLLARRRAHTLGSLISAGLSQQTARIAGASEVMFILLAGWILGIGGAMGCAPLIVRTLPPSARWFPGDFQVLNPTMALTAAFVVILCIASALRDRPVVNMRRSKLRGVSMWIIGIILMSVACLWRDLISQWYAGGPIFLGLIGLAFCGLGLLPAVVTFSRSLGQWIRQTHASGLLGGARLVTEARSAARGPAAIGLAVLAAGLITAITGQLVDYISGDSAFGSQRATVALIQTSHADQVATSIPGGVAIQLVIPEDGPQVIIADCQDVAIAFQANIDCNPSGTTLLDGSIQQPLDNPGIIASSTQILQPSQDVPDGLVISYVAYREDDLTST